MRKILFLLLLAFPCTSRIAAQDIHFIGKRSVDTCHAKANCKNPILSMPPVAADFQKYKITVQIMTKQEILEREDAQSTTIHLYKEGIFWKAYEYSANRLTA